MLLSQWERRSLDYPADSNVAYADSLPKPISTGSKLVYSLLSHLGHS